MIGESIMPSKDPSYIDYRKHITGFSTTRSPGTGSIEPLLKKLGEGPRKDIKKIDITRCMRFFLLGSLLQLPVLALLTRMFEVSLSHFQQIGFAIVAGFVSLILSWFLPQTGSFLVGMASGMLLHSLIKLAIAAGYLSSVLFGIVMVPVCLLILFMTSENEGHSDGLDATDRSTLNSWRPIGGGD